MLVSSSAHLVVAQMILGVSVSVPFIIALRTGTVSVALLRYRRDVSAIARNMLLGNSQTEEHKLGLKIVVAAIPGILAHTT